MLKVLTIIGTRPEAIKMAPVIHALNAEGPKIVPITCVTAQHREMLDQVLNIFNIKPGIDLNLMESDQDLTTLTSKIITQVGRVLDTVRPDVLLIQGDTTTVMAASLAAFYRKVMIGHVEAGLRTKDHYSPFPEEINRRITSVLTNFHFAPTELARKALLQEGIVSDCIFVTGNTVIDALKMVLSLPRPEKVDEILNSGDLTNGQGKMIVVTAHRRENFGQPLEQICKGLRELADRNPDILIVFPVHLNPVVRQLVFNLLSNVKNVCLIDPVEYDVMYH